MRPNTVSKLQEAIGKLNEAKSLLCEAYEGDSAEETIELIDYAIEDLQTDLDLFSVDE